MQIDGWKYYNHSAIPTTAPHEPVNIEPINNGDIWQIKGGTALLARWTNDWDCGHETQFWYVIKDEPFDINDLKSKRRYEINKGNKNFYVKRIKAEDYLDDLFRVTLEAYKGWPEKYRPKVSKEGFYVQIQDWRNIDIFAGFERESGKIQGYSVLSDYGSYVEFSILRTEPLAEKNAINAAMVFGILEYYRNRFDGHFYINDGSRAIRHETNFQDYLEKYFGFRKAYCNLNVRYKKGFGIIVKMLYPFRKIIKPDSGIGSKVSAILRMEEICRSS